MRGLAIVVFGSLSFFAVSCSDTTSTEPTSQTTISHKLTASVEQIIFTGDNRTDVTIFNVDLGFGDGTDQLVDFPPGMTKFIIPNNVTRVTINNIALPQGSAVPIMAGGKQVYVKWDGNQIVVIDTNEVS